MKFFFLSFFSFLTFLLVHPLFHHVFPKADTSANQSHKGNVRRYVTQHIFHVPFEKFVTFEVSFKVGTVFDMFQGNHILILYTLVTLTTSQSCQTLWTLQPSQSTKPGISFVPFWSGISFVSLRSPWSCVTLVTFQARRYLWTLWACWSLWSGVTLVTFRTLWSSVTLITTTSGIEFVHVTFRNGLAVLRRIRKIKNPVPVQCRRSLRRVRMHIRITMTFICLFRKMFWKTSMRAARWNGVGWLFGWLVGDFMNINEEKF